jgi:predicted metal-binding protein
MYEKDPYHPPQAPDVKDTKEMLREYKTAILLNGVNTE